jgi:plasmid stabilization system protein ParE
MTANILDAAEEDLERAFDYYQSQRAGLGGEFVDEFRMAVQRILEHPNAWHMLDNIYRRCQLHRFPYGVIYRIHNSPGSVLIVAIMHLSQRPQWWRGRDRAS